MNLQRYVGLSLLSRIPKFYYFLFWKFDNITQLSTHSPRLQQHDSHKETIRNTMKRQPTLTRRRTYVPAYFANPGYCSRLNGRPSLSFSLDRGDTMLGIIEACLHNPASVTTICVRRHRFLPEAPGPNSLKLSYLLSRYRLLRPSLHGHARVLRISKHAQARPVPREISSSVSLVSLMRFVYFCFERSRCTRLSRWERCEHSPGFVEYEDRTYTLM